MSITDYTTMDTLTEATWRAWRLQMEHELFCRPSAVIEQTPSAAICWGYNLVFDPEAADIYARQMNAIVTVCAWCKRTLSEKNTDGAKPGISHGICDDCKEAMKCTQFPS